MSRLPVAAAILATTLALAGCRNAQPADVAPTPVTEASPSEAGASVRRRDFQIVFKLEGATQETSSVGLVSNRQLSLRPSVPEGTPVQRGQKIGDLAVNDLVERALSAGAGTSRVDQGRLEQLRALAGPVHAPVSGIFATEAGQPVVQAPGIDVVVELNAVQDLRYRSLAFAGRAIVETVVGQREVPCHGVWLTSIVPAETIAEEGRATLSRLHCRLAPQVETAAGLRGRVVLESQTVRNALVVPFRLVGYDPQADTYYLNVQQAGGTVRVPVVAGVTDGVVRVVTGDIAEGARLLPAEDQT